MAKLDIPVEKLVKGKKPVSPKGMTVTSWKDLIVIRARQPGNKRQQTQLQRAWVANFKQIACWSKQPDPLAFDTAVELAKNTNWYYRDVIETALSGKLHRVGDEVRVTTPTASVRRNVQEALTSGAFKILTPDILEWDNNVFWNSTVNPSRLTIRSPGLYLIDFECEFTLNASAQIHIDVYLNGTTEIAWEVQNGLANFPPILGCQRTYYFHALDYIQPRVVVNQTGMSAKVKLFQLTAITPEAII